MPSLIQTSFLICIHIPSYLLCLYCLIIIVSGWVWFFHSNLNDSSIFLPRRPPTPPALSHCLKLFGVNLDGWQKTNIICIGFLKLFDMLTGNSLGLLFKPIQAIRWFCCLHLVILWWPRGHGGVDTVTAYYVWKHFYRHFCSFLCNLEPGRDTCTYLLQSNEFGEHKATVY